MLTSQIHHPSEQSGLKNPLGTDLKPRNVPNHGENLGLDDAREKCRFYAIYIERNQVIAQRSNFLSRLSTLPGVHQFDSQPQPLVYDSECERHAIIDVYANVCERWQLEEDKQLILLGYDSNELEGHNILTGMSDSLSRDVEDRAGYVVAISLGLSILFGEVLEAEMSWLKLVREHLNNKSPLDYMLEGSLVNLFVISEMVKRERGI